MWSINGKGSTLISRKKKQLPWHVWPVQTSLEQSLAIKQPNPLPQVLFAEVTHEPPQSLPVSSLFFTPSLHVVYKRQRINTHISEEETITLARLARTDIARAVTSYQAAQSIAARFVCRGHARTTTILTSLISIFHSIIACGH